MYLANVIPLQTRPAGVGAFTLTAGVGAFSLTARDAEILGLLANFLTLRR